MRTLINKFSVVIWTINGVLVLLGFILMAGAFAFAVIDDFRPDRTDAGLKNVSSDPLGEDQWTLGRVIGVPGSSFARVDLTSDKEAIDSSDSELGFFGSGGSGYSSRTAKNILFIDMATNESRWLFPSNSRTRSLDAGAADAEDFITKAFLYSVVDSDTNSEGKLDAEDDVVIDASRPDGSRYSELLTGVQRIVGTVRAGSDRFLVVYQKDNTAFTAIFRTSTLGLEQDDPLLVVGR